MITEVIGRIFHMHIPAETEAGHEEIVADAALQPAMGLLMITAGGVSASGSWPDRDQWGTKTFEEFLCARTPDWIAKRMLGEDAMIFDEDTTRKALVDACGESHLNMINTLLGHVDSHGEIEVGGQFATDMLNDIIKGSVDDHIFMRSTGFADFLIDGVLPALLERIAPPPVVTNQTNLKLC